MNFKAADISKVLYGMLQTRKGDKEIMLGKPKYTYDDKVSFVIKEDDKERKLKGVVYIIDAYGTFFDNSDVSYDIYVEEENCLYKHISEKSLFKED